VLLLDEADSFLQDRRGAQRTYEVTEVNEMLQGMERFAGIFICTTNLLRPHGPGGAAPLHVQDQVQAADGRTARAMFTAEALAGDATLLTPELRARLAGWSSCAPATLPPSSARWTYWRPSSAAEFMEPAGSRAPHQARGAGGAADGVFT
jgi:hypothetical protein